MRAVSYYGLIVSLALLLVLLGLLSLAIGPAAAGTLELLVVS
jgi:hypothetical protein